MEFVYKVMHESRFYGIIRKQRTGRKGRKQSDEQANTKKRTYHYR